jgi:uncharacterized protein (DUF427 family)
VDEIALVFRTSQFLLPNVLSSHGTEIRRISSLQHANPQIRSVDRGNQSVGGHDMSDILEPDRSILRNRRKWRYRGEERPGFAIPPGPGQESVWDYPRPPRIVSDRRTVEVSFEGRQIAETTRAVRVLETASPPTFYIPTADVRSEWLVDSGTRSTCEWKGIAVDFDLADGPRSVGWCYPRVFPEFESIVGWFSFYPARLVCRVDGESVRAQPGGYYGGWMTDEIVGPVKGEPGCDGL